MPRWAMGEEAGLDRLDGMQAFVAVAEAGSFSGAAARLGIARALVSKRIAGLEHILGVRLLNRTTRRVSLTGPGQDFLGRSQRILAEYGEATSTLSSLHAEPTGRLKLSAPMSFGLAHLAPLLPIFMRAHPKLVLELVLNDRFVDLVEEGFDLCVRIGTLADSSLVARRLATVRLVLCASPDYLRRRGMPVEPADLARHRGLIYGHGTNGGRWQLQGPAGSGPVEIPSVLCANNGDVLAEAAVAGEGITLAPTFIVGDALRAGTLVEVLAAYAPKPFGLYAIWPANRLLPAKVRLFVDFLASRFGDPPPWDQGLLTPSDAT
jgi:DNA-binding transcriptional LysR family regulator